jgi:predicted GNAT superfamily acetyltransferase
LKNENRENTDAESSPKLGRVAIDSHNTPRPDNPPGSLLLPTMEEIIIRECASIDELDSCVRLQLEVFGLPELEISPRRHLIVSRQAGGWTLGAFIDERLVGFVHHLAAVRGSEIFGYSHMMAVDAAYQNKGVGVRLKWSQRERAILEGRRFIKWTWDPMQARNAYFNLNRLGVTVSSYAENFYGTDYVTSPSLTGAEPAGIDSDRLFANWQLQSRRVKDLASGAPVSNETIPAKPAAMVDIPANWTKLIKEDPRQAKQEQLRVRQEFQNAFASGLIAATFERSMEHPRYLLYEKDAVSDWK